MEVDTQTAAPDETPDNAAKTDPEPSASETTEQKQDQMFGGIPLGEFTEAQRKVISDKGLKDAKALLDMYVAAEKKLGASISVPKADDAEGWKQLRRRLGAPEKIEDYGISPTDELDKGLLETAHALGMDKVMAKTFIEKTSAAVKAEDAAYEKKLADEYKAVSDQWGDKRKGNEDLIARGLSVYKLEKNALNALSEAIGTEKAVQLLIDAGRRVADGGSVGGGGGRESSDPLADYISKSRQRSS